MLDALRSSDGRIHASVVFVRGVNLVVWSCLLPFAAPAAYYIANCLPLWFNRATLTLGSVLIVAVPMAIPSSVSAVDSLRKEFDARLTQEREIRKSEHESFRREIGSQSRAIEAIRKDTGDVPVIKVTVKRIDSTLTYVAFAVIGWIVAAFIGLLIWVFQHFVLRARPAEEV